LHAEPESSVPKRPDAERQATEATAEARRHFKLGIKLYQDTNYPGALAEFEAAYAAKPGAGSLQNVALSQKALFRYREAAATLTQLLARHASELSDGEQKAVTEAKSELLGLVGSVVVTVEPSEAKVTLDGRPLTPLEMHEGIDLNVGEHTLVADLPGYARLSRVVSLASGQHQLPVELKLKATDAFLNIVSDEPRAAIAVDGVTRAFHEWHGGVKPDADHLIQVFRDGYESYESTVNVALGKTLDVRATLGPRIEGEATDAPASSAGVMPPPPPRRVPRGYYGLLSVGALGLGQHPLQLTGTRADSVMGTIGVRGGYRIGAPIAGELMLDIGRLSVSGATGEGSTAPRSYALTAARLGPNLHLMTTGKTFRFGAVLGTGVVRHKLTLEPAAAEALTGGTVSGFDPYFLLEVGLELSLSHWLLGAEVATLIDGATSLNREQVEGATKAFGSTNTLPLFGLRIHGGYSLW
jgi:hypothetical protein